MKTIEHQLEEMEFGKEGEFGILPLGKSMLRTYWPEEAADWEQTGVFNPVKGGVVLPGVEYVWVGKKGTKTRKMVSRGRIAIKPVPREESEMLLGLDEPDAMDPLEKLVCVEEYIEQYAREQGISLAEAADAEPTRKLRLMLGLDAPEFEEDAVEEPEWEIFPCFECGDSIAVNYGEEVPEYCASCAKAAKMRDFIEQLLRDEESDGINEFELDSFEWHEAIENVFGTNLPNDVSGKPEKVDKSRPARQSKWNDGHSGKRALPHKEQRLCSDERFFGARISESLFLRQFAVYDYQRSQFCSDYPDNVINLMDRLLLRLKQQAKSRIEVYGAPEKVADPIDREYYRRLFLPLEGHA